MLTKHKTTVLGDFLRDKALSLKLKEDFSSELIPTIIELQTPPKSISFYVLSTSTTPANRLPEKQCPAMTNSDMSDRSELHVPTNLDANMQLPTNFDFSSDSASSYSGFED